MINRILIPVDGSKGSEKAIEAAIEQAKHFDAEVDVLFVVEPPGSFYSPGYSYVKLLEETEAWGNRVLAQVETELNNAGVDKVRTHIDHGHPAQIILNKVETLKADLIVMGSHGRRGLDRILLGSVATEVLHASKIPVLVVRLSNPG